MNTNLQTWSYENSEIRTVEKDGEPWFVGKDVAAVLGYSNTRDALAKHVDDEDKNTVVIRDGIQGNPNTIVINESGLYSLVLSSKLPNAKKFKRWVTSDVLPSIRKHGAYMTDQTLEQALTSPDFLIQLATQLKEEKEARLKAEQKTIEQEKTIEVLKPKADYTDMILKNNSLVTITQIAKDYGMSGKAMNSKLHEMKIIYNLNGQWLLYSKYQSQGYVHSETFPIKHKNGYEDTKMNTKWTQKGRLFLYERLKAQGITPIIERMTR